MLLILGLKNRLVESRTPRRDMPGAIPAEVEVSQSGMLQLPDTDVQSRRSRQSAGSTLDSSAIQAVESVDSAALHRAKEKRRGATTQGDQAAKATSVPSAGEGDGWFCIQTNEATYYWNKNTKESTWDSPRTGLILGLGDPGGDGHGGACWSPGLVRTLHA